jgi:hypothetical protein
MAQIQKGDTFTDGQQVTGARLNQLVDSAVILPNIISDQSVIGVPASDDKVLLYHNDDATLKKADLSDILGANIPIVSSSIYGGGGESMTINPDGVNKTASACAFNSFNSNKTVLVTSTNHGLQTGQFIQIYGSSDSAYNGNVVITWSNTNAFQYNVLTAGTSASGTLNYTTFDPAFFTLFVKSNESVIGNKYVSGGAYIGSDFVVGGNSYVSGNLTVNGITQLNGTVNIPTIPTSNDNAANKAYVDGSVAKVYIKNGQSTGDFTGSTSTEKTVYITPTLPTPPSDETWIFEFYFTVTGGNGQDANTRATGNATKGRLYKNTSQIQEQSLSAGTMYFTTGTFCFTHSLTSADVGVTLSLKLINQYSLMYNPWYIVKMTKVKTAQLSNINTYL